MKTSTQLAPLASWKSVCRIFSLFLLLTAFSLPLLQAQPVSHEMIQEPADTNNGDLVELIVYLGTSSEPVASTSHVIFTFSYDPDTYNPGSSLGLDFGNSFFIAPGQQHNATVTADEQARTITLDIENLTANGSGHGEVARVTGGMLVVADVLKDEDLISASTRNADFQLYPTLVSDYFRVSGESIRGAWLEVVDLQGKVVRRVQIPVTQTKYTVPASELKDGMYKVRVAAADAAKAVTSTFIKQ